MISRYTHQMEYIGPVDKKEAHQEGYWHKVATGIVYNPVKKTIFFQTIYPKDSYGFDRPDYIDFAVGGHIEENETPLEGLYREAKEELGLSSSNMSKKYFLGVRRINKDLTESYKLREFQYLYAIPVNFELEDFKMNNSDAEVKSIVKVRINRLIDLLDNRCKEIEVQHRILDRNTRQTIDYTCEFLTKKDIIPDYFVGDFLLNILYTLKANLQQAYIYHCKK